MINAILILLCLFMLSRSAFGAEKSPLIPVVSAIQSAVKPERAMAIMRSIYATDRWFTFPKFEQTAQYLSQRLLEAGLSNVEILGAPADGKSQFGYWTMPLAWDVKSARLDVLEPEHMILTDRQSVPASVGMWCGPTPPEGIVAEVVGSCFHSLDGSQGQAGADGEKRSRVEMGACSLRCSGSH